MNFKIRWSILARHSFQLTIENVLEQWTDREAREFASLTMKTIAMIINYPEIFPSSSRMGGRRATVHKHVSLYYSIDQAKKEIRLELFWDNRMDPEKLTN